MVELQLVHAAAQVVGLQPDGCGGITSVKLYDFESCNCKRIKVMWEDDYVLITFRVFDIWNR